MIIADNVDDVELPARYHAHYRRYDVAIHSYAPPDITLMMSPPPRARAGSEGREAVRMLW